MPLQKPKFEEYKKWLKDSQNVEITNRVEQHYSTTTNRIKNTIENTDFWKEFLSNLREYFDQYRIDYGGYDLFQSRGFTPNILIKSFNSMLEKTYRKNIFENKLWPKPPQEGWILPDNWFTRINDIIRTSIMVRYLDGIDFIVNKLRNIGSWEALNLQIFYEARDEGYYAVHMYTNHKVEIPKITLGTEEIQVTLEIQLTTQIKEVIRGLLHSYYEEKRKSSGNDKKWQWQYNSDEFEANYLGHIAHYLEGMIMDVREKERKRVRKL